jgi:hypothetical protein
VLGQLAQPGRVAHVGLAAGQELDVAGVDQQQLQPALLQHIPDRLPVLAGRLHHHLGDVVVLEPGGEGLQTGAEGGKGAQLLVTSARVIGHADTGHDLVLADVEPGAAVIDHLHRGPPPRRGGCPAGPTESTTLKGVLAATVRGAGKVPASV